eukprot:GFYU01004607.1.p1 GENE.GFYU01004607.1~~GFYU01004607.1.p1  ORF type:complete len:301 (-),score=36.29 GFYU01004607.1:128-1030(-)
MQQLMSGNCSAVPTDREDSSPTATKAEAAATDGEEVRVKTPENEIDFSPSYRDEQKGILGCKHYMRTCKLRAACCGDFFPCRLCHDEVCDHQMDRYAVKEMMCMKCKTIQPAGAICTSVMCAGERMAKYYCDTCKFWDDTPEKNIYHCPYCNMCRIGKGLGIDFFHCMKCNACMTIGLQNNHRCIERSLDGSCPICLEGSMFTSTQPIVSLLCGHVMHDACFKQYIKTQYTCPICSKSLADMSDRFKQLDALIALQEMPEEFKKQKTEILCNDCTKKSHVQFHFMYHKCPHCSSYNTRRV